MTVEVLKKEKIKKMKTSKSVIKNKTFSENIQSWMDEQGYKEKFDAEPKVIDLRAMAKNFDLGVIKGMKINDVINLVIPQMKKLIDDGHVPKEDPYKDKDNLPQLDGSIHPQPQYLDREVLSLLTLFQRNVIPENILKIFKDFDITTPSTIEVLKFTYKGEVLWLIWDGHHTYQICVLRGYSRLLCKVVDMDAYTDEQMIKEYFKGENRKLSEDERFKFVVWKGGMNFLRNNCFNKEMIDDFNRYMVQFSIGHKPTMDLEDVLRRNDCQIVRKEKKGGDITQVKIVEQLFQKEKDGKKGVYLDMALRTCRKTWPDLHMELEVYRPLAELFQLLDEKNISVDDEFITKLGAGLKKEFGSAEKVQTKLKKSYESAIENQDFRLTAEKLPSNNKMKVLAGIINVYQQKIWRDNKDLPLIPEAEVVWTIK